MALLNGGLSLIQTAAGGEVDMAEDSNYSTWLDVQGGVEEPGPWLGWKIISTFLIILC